jgi:hypothetical protein
LKLARLDLIWVFSGLSIIAAGIGIYVTALERKNQVILIGFITILLYYLIVARYAQESWGIQYHLFLVPFASLGVGVGMDWLRSKQPVWLRTSLPLLLAVTTVAGSAYMYQRMLSEEGNSLGKELIQCATKVEKLVPEDAHIIVSTTSFSTENGVQNNYQEPTIFFYSKRYGWSLPADWHTPDRLDYYRKQGGQYFIMYSRELLESHIDLAQYLAGHAIQIGPGVEAGCGIYQFNQR